MPTSKTFTITSLTPMLMHCGQTVDVLNPFAKALKKVSAKRSKTDDDHALMAHIEWWAGLYLDKPANISADLSVSAEAGTKIVLPAHLLDSVLREGARRSKMGKSAAAGVIVEGDGIFSHDGPKDLNKLAQDGRFVHRAAVKVGAAKVMRTRPIFTSWSVEFTICFDESIMDLEQIIQSLDNAGKLVGVGDWRPGAPRGGNFGRFELVK